MKELKNIGDMETVTALQAVLHEQVAFLELAWVKGKLAMKGQPGMLPGYPVSTMN